LRGWARESCGQLTEDKVAGQEREEEEEEEARARMQNKID